MPSTRLFCALVALAAACARAQAAGDNATNATALPAAPDGGVSVGLCAQVGASDKCELTFRSVAPISAWQLHVRVGNQTGGANVNGTISGGQSHKDGMTLGKAGGAFVAIFESSDNSSAKTAMPAQSDQHQLAVIKVKQPSGKNATNATRIQHLCLHAAHFYNSNGDEVAVAYGNGSLCQDADSGGSDSSSSSKWGLIFLIVLLVMVVLGGGFFALRWWQKRRQARRNASNAYGYAQENI